MQREKLHFFHIAVTIYMAQTGVDMFRLPQVLAENFGTNGWIAVIIVSAFVTLNIYLIYLVYRLGKGRSVFQILESFVPRFLLVPFYLGMGVLFALLASSVCMHYIFMVKSLSFPTISPALLNGLLLTLAFIFVSLGIYNMVKASTIFFFLTIWTLCLLLFHIADFDFVRLTPHLFSGGNHYYYGLFRIFVAFFGFEVLLFFLPYVQKPTNLFKAAFLGHMITTTVYIIVPFISFGFFSFEQLKYLLSPGIELLSYIQLPFVERIENIVFNLFIGEIIITVGLYYWIAQQSISRVFKKVKPSYLLLLIIVATFIFSIQFDTITEIRGVLDKLDIYHIPLVIGLPVLLIIILVIKNKLAEN